MRSSIMLIIFFSFFIPFVSSTIKNITNLNLALTENSMNENYSNKGQNIIRIPKDIFNSKFNFMKKLQNRKFDLFSQSNFNKNNSKNLRTSIFMKFQRRTPIFIKLYPTIMEFKKIQLQQSIENSLINPSNYFFKHYILPFLNRIEALAVYQVLSLCVKMDNFLPKIFTLQKFKIDKIFTFNKIFNDSVLYCFRTVCSKKNKFLHLSPIWYDEKRRIHLDFFDGKTFCSENCFQENDIIAVLENTLIPFKFFNREGGFYLAQSKVIGHQFYLLNKNFLTIAFGDLSELDIQIEDYFDLFLKPDEINFIKIILFPLDLFVRSLKKYFNMVSRLSNILQKGTLNLYQSFNKSTEEFYTSPMFLFFCILLCFPVAIAMKAYRIFFSALNVLPFILQTFILHDFLPFILQTFPFHDVFLNLSPFHFLLMTLIFERTYFLFSPLEIKTQNWCTSHLIRIRFLKNKNLNKTNIFRLCFILILIKILNLYI